MAIKPVLMIGNPRLRETSSDVVFEEDNVAAIVQDLADTLHHLQHVKGLGRAIAAVQIGYLKRIVYMEAGGKRIVMINPRIISRSEETQYFKKHRSDGKWNGPAF